MKEAAWVIKIRTMIVVAANAYLSTSNERKVSHSYLTKADKVGTIVSLFYR